MLGLLTGEPIGLADIEIEADGRASFAIAIDPARRNMGLGRQMTDAIIHDPRLVQTRELYAGVEERNLASRRLLESCGFARTAEQDADGFVYYARSRM